MSEPLNPAIAAPASESSANTLSHLRVTGISFADGTADERLNRRGLKCFLYRTRGIIDGPMQRAKISAMSGDPKRARPDALYGIYCRNDLKHRELIRGPRSLEAAPPAALRPNQPGTGKQAQNFRQVIGRHM
jgi:hypothetical protein